MGCCDSFSRNKIDTISFHNPKSKKTINFFPPSDSRLASEYQILSVLKKNNFSNFKKVVQISTNRAFILQTIPKEGLSESNISILAGHLSIIKNFKQENIVEILDYLSDDMNLYLILEFFDETELFDKISREGVFREAEAKKIIKAVLKALKYSHDYDIGFKFLFLLFLKFSLKFLKILKMNSLFPLFFLFHLLSF
jgi:serine/threonine protein kinase